MSVAPHTRLAELARCREFMTPEEFANAKAIIIAEITGSTPTPTIPSTPPVTPPSTPSQTVPTPAPSRRRRNTTNPRRRTSPTPTPQRNTTNPRRRTSPTSAPTSAPTPQRNTTNPRRRTSPTSTPQRNTTRMGGRRNPTSNQSDRTLSESERDRRGYRLPPDTSQTRDKEYIPIFLEEENITTRDEFDAWCHDIGYQDNLSQAKCISAGKKIFYSMVEENCWHHWHEREHRHSSETCAMHVIRSILN
jgi:hypothetical protein